jgi:hypothetical protein
MVLQAAAAAHAASPDVVLPALWAALGFGLKSIVDSFFSRRNQVTMESWKIRARILEQRLSEFYWPLYAALMRDQLLWQKVFEDLRAPAGQGPEWLQRVADDQRRQLSVNLESGVLLPNHLAAVQVIREKMHLANADNAFETLLGRYVRHVDIYDALRKTGIDNVDPMNVGEAFPHDLTEEVKARLDRYQAEEEGLLRERGLLDLSTARTKLIGRRA